MFSLGSGSPSDNLPLRSSGEKKDPQPHSGRVEEKGCHVDHPFAGITRDDSRIRRILSLVLLSEVVLSKFPTRGQVRAVHIQRSTICLGMPSPVCRIIHRELLETLIRLADLDRRLV